jgi:serine/threonine-protein kinase RsbW
MTPVSQRFVWQDALTRETLKAEGLGCRPASTEAGGRRAMIEHRPALLLRAGPPGEIGDRCGSWPLQMAPQLARVRSAVEQLARLRYAHPSLETPEPSLLGVMERLALVVSELGSNALRHGQAPITVSLHRMPGGWLLKVSDGDPRSVPMMGPTELSSGHRHGLEVVALVSTQVGWYVDDSGKHVWAAVPDQTPEGLSHLIRD